MVIILIILTLLTPAEAFTAKTAQAYLSDYIKAGYYHDTWQKRHQGKGIFIENAVVDADMLEALVTYFKTYGKDLAAVSIKSCNLTDVDADAIFRNLPRSVSYVNLAYNAKISDDTGKLLVELAPRFQNVRYLDLRQASLTEEVQESLTKALCNADIRF